MTYLGLVLGLTDKPSLSDEVVLLFFAFAEGNRDGFEVYLGSSDFDLVVDVVIWLKKRENI